MFSKVLLILIVAACLCLLIYPASALMQSKRPDFRLEVFNPLGQPAQSQSQSQETSAEVIDPTKPSNQTISVTLFDPRIPESDPRFIQNSGKIGASQQDLTPAAASDIRISQIYTRGGEAGATFQPDFIEIFNAGTTTININGWGIIVDTFEGSTEQAVGARYTSDTLVTPGMHLLIRFATAGNSGQPLTGVLPTVTSTSLGSTSGKIFLLSPSQTQTTGCPTSIGPSGTVSDLLGYGPTTCSEGSPAPAPPASNKSITRVNANCLDTDNNSTDFTVTDPNPRNFTDIGTPCSGSNPAPTPGSGNLRISQVYTRGGEAGATYNQDYVELFNPGTGDVDINGWTLTVKTAEGGITNNISIVANQSFAIKPGMHVTFPFNGNGTNGQALPSTKFTSTNSFLGSTSGQIILLAPGQAIPSGCPVSGNYVDFVGYGSSQCSETSPVPVPASNKSMTRINGGCTDTNNNLNDFSAVDPNPRTFQSPLAQCGSQSSPTPTPSPTSSPIDTASPPPSPTPTPSPIFSPTPIPSPSIGFGTGFMFSNSQYEVWEGPTGLVITVFRSFVVNTGSGTASVDYTTSNGTAVAPGDYTTTSGTLTFGPNETVKSFKIPVADDGVVEPDETFNVTLSNPVGLEMGSPSSATVTIHDNDAPLPTNPRIRISQVYARGGEAGATYQRDFIELFNADSTAVNIQGWSVIITALDASGNANSVGGTIGSSILLQPGQHVILTMPGTGNNGQVLNAEFSIDSISLGSTGGQIFLIPKDKLVLPFTCPSTAPDPRGEVADFVAYGAGTCSAGGVAPVPAPNKSLTRIGGGCTNTFDNSADFVLTDPTPHKFADPISPACGAAANSTIQFAAAQSNVSEGAGSATITVTRTGDLASVATVDYSTTDGTASERTDYNRTAGTLRFGAGESQKTFDILITDDSIQEPTETVTLNLSRPAGNGVLGATTSATLFILDNDSSTGTTNPLDSSPFYVNEQYHDFLNRVADPSGLQFWINGIETCGSDAQCRDVKRIDTSAAFFLSIEFQSTGFEVYRAYKAAFPNSAERPRGMVRYREFLRDTQGISRGVIVGNNGWEAQIEANKVAFFTRFVSNPEFLALYPGTMTSGDYVDALIKNTGVQFSGAQRNDLVNGLISLKETRATVLRKIAENQDFTNAEFNRAFVLMQYYGYLRRNVDDLPDKDFSGFDFWLNKLNQFNGDYRAAEMVKAFLASTEYRQRFGSQ